MIRRQLLFLLVAANVYAVQAPPCVAKPLYTMACDQTFASALNAIGGWFASVGQAIGHAGAYLMSIF